VEDALAWYDSERVNVVAATRQAASAGLHDVAWRLSTALFPVFNRRANWADCATTHRIAWDSVRKAAHRQGEGWVLNNLGEALARMRDHEGFGFLERALAIRREIGDRVGEGQAAMHLADAYFQIKGPEIAFEYMRHAVEVLREAGHPSLYGTAVNNLGEVYLELGRLDEAARCFEDACQILADIGRVYVEGYARHNLGRVYLGLGRTEDTFATLREALTIHRSTGDRFGQAITLKFLGQAHRSSGQVTEARESWNAALRLFIELDEKEQITEIESVLARP
jgi:tetratricopeptide (TPR) repeat protein